MYSLPPFLLPFFMASSTTLSLKSVRVAHPLRHLRFLACMRHRVRIPPVHLRMRSNVRDHTHRGEVSLSVRLILCKIRNIPSIRRTLDISSKNGCCNCDLYSGKYSKYDYWLISLLSVATGKIPLANIISNVQTTDISQPFSGLISFQINYLNSKYAF